MAKVSEGQMGFYAAGPPAVSSTAFKDMPIDERPVHRLSFYGPGALSVTELLAVVTGAADYVTVQRLLLDGGLSGLARKPFSELTELPGIGQTKAAQVKAAFELGRRLLVSAPSDRLVIKTPVDVANQLMSEMGLLEHEELRIVVLNTKNHVLKIFTLYVGSLNTAQVRVGEVFREAIRLNSAAIIIVHNHPSNDVTPSAEDIYVTRQFVEAGKLLNIDVLDHLIICQSRWVSLKERGLGF